jgi:hypothetical protein
VRLAAVVALFAVGVTLISLLLRWMTGELRLARLARRRRAEQPPAPPPPELRPAPPPARRRPAAGHHPAGRRAPGSQPARDPVVPQPPTVQTPVARSPVARPPAARAPRLSTPGPRRPLESVAADLRRLNRELSMVPGGMPMARRRGLLAAFDDVLIEAADLLEVPHEQLTAGPPAGRELERMRLLAMLEAAGLVVSD